MNRLNVRGLGRNMGKSLPCRFRGGFNRDPRGYGQKSFREKVQYPKVQLTVPIK
jgi:hypothetical protein